MIKNFKLKIENAEKGVSLIIAFFVMVTIIAVVVSLSILLYGQIKILGNISNAVSAFYLADGGAEKVLYYDRRATIPAGASRGICNICTENVGVKVCPDCEECVATPKVTDGCTDCTNCDVSFKTTITGQEKFYDVTVDVSRNDLDACPIAEGVVNSYGTNKNTKRAINLNISNEIKTGLGPSISNDGTWVTGGQVIHFRVIAPPPSELEGGLLLAYVSYSATEGGPYTLIDDPGNPVSLSYNSGQNEWQGNYNTGITGYFSISIGGTDSGGVCASITITF